MARPPTADGWPPSRASLADRSLTYGSTADYSEFPSPAGLLEGSEAVASGGTDDRDPVPLDAPPALSIALRCVALRWKLGGIAPPDVPDTNRLSDMLSARGGTTYTVSTIPSMHRTPPRGRFAA